MATTRPTLGHSLGSCLTHLMIILKVTSQWVWIPQSSRAQQWDSNWGSFQFWVEHAIPLCCSAPLVASELFDFWFSAIFTSTKPTWHSKDFFSDFRHIEVWLSVPECGQPHLTKTVFSVSFIKGSLSNWKKSNLYISFFWKYSYLKKPEI